MTTNPAIGWVDLATAKAFPPNTRMLIRWQAGGSPVYHLHDNCDFRAEDWNDVAYTFLNLSTLDATLAAAAGLAEVVKDAITEIPTICRCNMAYKDRGLTDPECHACRYEIVTKRITTAIADWERAGKGVANAK